MKKRIVVLAYVFGLLLIAEAFTNQTQGENLVMMAGLAVIGWTAIFNKYA
jgi:hypothetical protein